MYSDLEPCWIQREGLIIIMSVSSYPLPTEVTFIISIVTQYES